MGSLAKEGMILKALGKRMEAPCTLRLVMIAFTVLSLAYIQESFGLLVTGEKQ